MAKANAVGSHGELREAITTPIHTANYEKRSLRRSLSLSYGFPEDHSLVDPGVRGPGWNVRRSRFSRHSSTGGTVELDPDRQPESEQQGQLLRGSVVRELVELLCRRLLPRQGNTRSPLADSG